MLCCCRGSECSDRRTVHNIMAFVQLGRSLLRRGTHRRTSNNQRHPIQGGRGGVRVRDGLCELCSSRGSIKRYAIHTHNSTSMPKGDRKKTRSEPWLRQQLTDNRLSAKTAEEKKEKQENAHHIFVSVSANTPNRLAHRTVQCGGGTVPRTTPSFTVHR